MNLKGRTELFTSDHVVEGSRTHADFTGQVLVFTKYQMDEFHPPYQKPEFQLFYAQGGFGCSPIAMGRAVVGVFVADGEGVRYNRGDFLGVLKPELVEEYEINIKQLLEEL